MNRDIIGYLLGLIIFIIGVPYVMFLAAGSPNLAEIGLIKWIILIVFLIFRRSLRILPLSPASLSLAIYLLPRGIYFYIVNAITLLHSYF